MTSLIIIAGNQNTGKTTIAWGVYLRLREYATAVRFFDNNDNEMFPVDDIIYENGLAQDFYAFLTIHRQTFMIVSGGDSKRAVKDAIEKGWNMRVDGILQCARDSIKTIRDYIHIECGNMPQVEYRTTSVPPSSQKAHQDAIIEKICNCILEP